MLTTPFYFCLAADNKYFDLLCNMIGSIHKTNFDQLGEIAVFDIGLSQNQRAQVKSMRKTKLYAVEMVHPDLLTCFTARHGTRSVPGWYAWKPVIIKQSLDMFPHVLYSDVGYAIAQPLDSLFSYVQKHGYLFIESDYSIGYRITDYVASTFDVNDTLKSKKGIRAGVQAITHDIYNSYVLPLYECAKNLQNFAEDGTTENPRHDQIPSSIFVQRNNFAMISGNEKCFFVNNKPYSIYELIDYEARNKPLQMKKHIKYK